MTWGLDQNLNPIQLNNNGGETMSKLGEEALNYKPGSKTKVISDLKEVSTDLDLIDDEFDYDGKTIKQKVIVVEDEKYRVPITVIQQLQVILKDNPEVKKFKVLKSGTTKDDTKYTVVPIVQTA